MEQDKKETKRPYSILRSTWIQFKQLAYEQVPIQAYYKIFYKIVLKGNRNPNSVPFRFLQ